MYSKSAAAGPLTRPPPRPPGSLLEVQLDEVGDATDPQAALNGLLLQQVEKAARKAEAAELREASDELCCELIALQAENAELKARSI